MRVTDKIISIEAAKLLGVPFTWAGCFYACKFVYGDDGLELKCRGIRDYGIRRFGSSSWVAPDDLAKTAVEDLEKISSRLRLVEEDSDEAHR